MHERQKTYIEVLLVSNRSLRKFTAMVKPLQDSLVVHTMKVCIPNVLNNVLNFFFADHIVLFLCKYKDIDGSRSYSILSTELFDADKSVNLSGVDFSCLIRHSGEDVRFNLVPKYFFSLPDGLGRGLCNREHDLFSIYQ